MAQPKKPETYTKIKLLGEGSFGKAFLVECQSTKKLAVIKQMDIGKMTPKEKEEVLKEAKILEAMKHPNIIQFLEVYTTINGKLCIVMDYADGGDLSNKIRDAKGRYLQEPQILDWFTQICLAIKHIHDRKVIHRDIKGQNIFLTKDGKVKLGDFGIAKVLSNTIDRAKSIVGTPYYMSPEIIERKPYSFQSDVWSLGILLYEMCALKPPFDAPGMNFLMEKIVKGSFSPVPYQYSKDLKNLIAQLLHSDPKKRPTVNQILRTPIISAKIKGYLSETTYKLEFSHTILHNKSAFDKNGNPIKQPAPPILAPANNPVDLKKIPQTSRGKPNSKIEIISKPIEKQIAAKLDLKAIEKPKQVEAKESTPKAKMEEKEKNKKQDKPKTPLAKDYKSERPNDNNHGELKSIEDSKKERAKKIEMFMRQKAPVIVHKEEPRAHTPLNKKNESPAKGVSDSKLRSPSEKIQVKNPIKEKIEALRKKESEERQKRVLNFKEKINDEKNEIEKNSREEQRKKMKEDIVEKKKAYKNANKDSKDIEWPGRYEYPTNDSQASNNQRPKEKIAKELLDMQPADVSKLQIYKKQLESLVYSKESEEESNVEIEEVSVTPYIEREDSVGEEAKEKEIVINKSEKHIKAGNEVRQYVEGILGTKFYSCYELFKAEFNKSNGLSGIDDYTDKLKNVITKEEVESLSGFLLAMVYEDNVR